MNEITEELEVTTPKKRGIPRYNIMLLLLFSALIFFGVYVGKLMFGANSLEVMIKLDSRERYLKEKIDTLQNVNANLQKEYFELKELEADVD